MALLKSILQLKIEIKENVKCWEYVKWNHYNTELSNRVFVGNTKYITRVVFPDNLLANTHSNIQIINN